MLMMSFRIQFFLFNSILIMIDNHTYKLMK